MHAMFLIQCMQGVAPSCFTFYQAQDGHMHISVYPSADASKDTYPVYRRTGRPQPKMFVSTHAHPHALCVSGVFEHENACLMKCTGHGGMV